MLRMISHVLKQDDLPFFLKIKKFFEFTRYYKNLRVGLSSGNIYHNMDQQNKDFEIFVSSLIDKDFELFDLLFNKNIKVLLVKTGLEQTLDFDKKIGIKQIGYNTIYVTHPVAGLWTTGKATFYVPTKKGLANKIIINIFSIPPLKVTVGFEGKKIKNVSMGKLTTKRIEIELEPNKLTADVSEIFINTDKLWLPSIILGVEDWIKIGVMVKSIQISYP